MARLASVLAISDVQTVSSVKTSDTQNILRSGPKYIAIHGGGGRTPIRTTERPKKVVCGQKKKNLDVRFMADPPLPFNQTSLMDGPYL